MIELADLSPYCPSLSLMGLCLCGFQLKCSCCPCALVTGVFDISILEIAVHVQNRIPAQDPAVPVTREWEKKIRPKSTH